MTAMLKTCLTGILIGIAVTVTTAQFREKTEMTSAKAVQDPKAYNQKLSHAGLLFTENKGQVADDKGTLRPDILFTAHSGGAKIYLTATGIHYQFTKTDYPAGYEQDERTVRDHEKQDALRRQIKTNTHRFTLSLEGASHNPHIQKEEQNEYTENFYLGHCPQGVTGVHTYSRIVYENVYPGIDWVIYSARPSSGAASPSFGGGRGEASEAGMKYDFIVHPGADYREIRLTVKDADEVRIANNGELVMKTSLGEVREQAPVSFVDGKEVATQFVQDGKNEFGFEVVGYDRGKELRIDPSVVWATYYGGSGNDDGRGCSTDNFGNVYLTGYTLSAAGIASAGAFHTQLASDIDAFLVKFSSNGSRLWGTYFGGPSLDQGWSCATDLAGNVIITGNTASLSAIATTGAHQTSFGGSWPFSDAYIAKFNGNGIRLWSSYYGGTEHEQGLACTTDPYGNIYLSGMTESANAIAAGGFQNAIAGMSDGFLVKFSPNGVRQWATYYGGSGGEIAYGCATDLLGNVFITGTTGSTTGISTGGAHQVAPISGNSAFLVKFNPNGLRLWGTYFGGAGENRANACAVDKTSNVYITGWTDATGFIASPNAFQTSPGGVRDAFLAKFNTGGTRLWASYYGGSSHDLGYSCAIDSSNNVFATGCTSSSTGIASVGAIQNVSNGGGDAFLVKFDSSGNRIWGTYFGGNAGDYGFSCAADNPGNIYVAGLTQSTSGLAFGGYQNSHSGTGDAYLVKIKNSNSITTVGVAGSPLCAGASLSIPFTSTGAFAPGNTYTAQLSNAAGSFANPILIGTVASTANSGSIPAIIPINTPAGSGYRIRVVSSAPVVTGADNGADITIHTIPAQPGPIAGNTPVCTGTAQTYSVSPVAGALSYTWTIPATWAGISNTPSINTVAGSSGGIIAVTATNACGTSPASTLSVVAGTNVIITPSVTISTNNPSFCTGIPATFTATASNGGAAPIYQWKKNGINVGPNSATYSDPAPQTGDVIIVQLTSNAPCAAAGTVTSNAITESSTPSVVPGININTIPPYILCQGSPIQFVTNITAGGPSPQYAWYKNGVLLPGVTTPDYTDAALQNGDTLQVFLTSSAACPATQPTPSNRRGVTVIPQALTAVSISATPGTSGLAEGTPVTFTAIYSGGGTAPVFTWRKNSVAIPMATGPVYSTSFTGTPAGLSRNDEISVTMFSNDPCPSSSLVTSNILQIASSTGIDDLHGASGSLILYPNPNTGHFTIAGERQPRSQAGVIRVDIFNTLGQKVYSQESKPTKARFSIEVELGPAIANGIYQIRVYASDMQLAKPFVIQR